MKSFPDLKELIAGIDSRLEGLGDSVSLVLQAGAEAPDPVVKYVLVAVGKRHLALPIDNLAEVSSLPKVTSLPNLPDWIRGIMNIRSEIISLIDFSGFLGEGLAVREESRKLVVLRRGKMKVGIAVRAIVGTVTKSVKEVLPQDRDFDNPLAGEIFLSSILVDGSSYAILDAEKFLEHPRLVDYGGETGRRNAG